MAEVRYVTHDEVYEGFQRQLEREGVSEVHLMRIWQEEGAYAVAEWLEDHNFWSLREAFKTWQPSIERYWPEGN